MKKLFLIISIVAFSFASAQNNFDTFWVKTIPPAYKKYTPRFPKNYFVIQPRQLTNDPALPDSLPNGNKVYALPQDNMPCVVPDMLQYNMPVIKPGVPYIIPNPAFPPTDKPTTLSPGQLRMLLEKYKKN